MQGTQAIQEQTQVTVTQLNKSFKDAVARAEKAEKELTELKKKLDDYKRAYNETKANLSKAQSDL